MNLEVTKDQKSYVLWGSGKGLGLVRLSKKPGGRDLATRTLDKAENWPTFSYGTITFAGEEYVPNREDEALAWIEALGVNRPKPTSSKPARSLFTEDIGAVKRWQYATVNTGMFNSAERLTEVLGEAGRVGWELVTVYDKSSNWFGGMEKGFMLLRREVPDGVEPEAWSIQFSG
jgi:hypothetical protein